MADIKGILAMVLSIVALVLSGMAVVTPGTEGPEGPQGPTGATGSQGPIGPQGPPGPAPNVVSVDGLAECHPITGGAAYTVNVYMVNLGSTARSLTFKIRYFQTDGTTLAYEGTHTANLQAWGMEIETVEQTVNGVSGCAYPHVVWDSNANVIGWRS